MTRDVCLLLRKDLRGPLPPAHWPAGIRVVSLSDSCLPDAHALLVEGYAPGHGSVEPLERWREALIHDAEYDPQLCFLAMQDARVVGVAQGWTSAYLKDLVVHPHYQGLGIASALLAHVFSVFKQRGEACVDLKVMAHNLKACCLYRKHGMALVQRLSI